MSFKRGLHTLYEVTVHLYFQDASSYHRQISMIQCSVPTLYDVICHSHVHPFTLYCELEKISFHIDTKL